MPHHQNIALCFEPVPMRTGAKELAFTVIDIYW